MIALGAQSAMADHQSEIRRALDAIKQASRSDLTISRAAVGRIEELIRVIDALVDHPTVRQEGQYLLSRILGRVSAGAESTQASAVVWEARLHGTIARYELALRRAGFLDAPEGEARPDRARTPPPAA